ncbi:MAG: hypothetical protein ABI423_02640 [Burkholderiales bacterium]
MKLYKAARTMLRVTALAWAIPLVQAAEPPQAGASRPLANSVKIMRLAAHAGNDSSSIRIGQKRRKTLKT